MTMFRGIPMLLQFSIHHFPSTFPSIRKTLYMLAIIPQEMFKLVWKEALILSDPFPAALLPLSHPTKMCLSGMRIAESIGGQRMQLVVWP